MRDVTLGFGIMVGFAAIGFFVGIAVGQSTRSAISGATKTSYKGGTFTVEVDTEQALKDGIRAGLARLGIY